MRWLMRCGRRQRNVSRKPAIKFVGMADACSEGSTLRKAKSLMVRDNLKVTVQEEKCSTSRSDLRTVPDGRDALVS